MVKTITASVIATGFATGARKSASASNELAGVSFTGTGGRSGAACFSMSLIASAALPMVLRRSGWRSAWIFFTMFWRYSGSLAASDTACVAATAVTARIAPKPSTATTSVEATRPNFQPSRRRTAGASRNDSRMATASGISTSAARYSTAVAMISPMTDERRGRARPVPVAAIAARPARRAAASARLLRRRGRCRSGCRRAGPACWYRPPAPSTSANHRPCSPPAA